MNETMSVFLDKTSCQKLSREARLAGKCSFLWNGNFQYSRPEEWVEIYSASLPLIICWAASALQDVLFKVDDSVNILTAECWQSENYCFEMTGYDLHLHYTTVTLCHAMWLLYIHLQLYTTTFHNYIIALLQSCKDGTIISHHCCQTCRISSTAVFQ